MATCFVEGAPYTQLPALHSSRKYDAPAVTSISSFSGRVNSLAHSRNFSEAHQKILPRALYRRVMKGDTYSLQLVLRKSERNKDNVCGKFFTTWGSFPSRAGLGGDSFVITFWLE